MTRQKHLSPTELLDFLRIEYEVVSDGEEARVLCPFCGNPDRKFYVRVAKDEGEGLFNCFHCHIQGNHEAFKTSLLEKVVLEAATQKQGQDYWRSRGLTDSTIVNARLGYWLPMNRYTVPYIQDGKVVNISFRAVNENEKERYLRIPHVANNYYFPPTRELELEEGVTPNAVVVEGEINALAVQEAWPTALVIGVPGADYVRDSLLNLIPRTGAVFAIFDKDTSGKRGLRKVRGLLPSVRVVELGEEYKDPNDVLCGIGSDGLRRLIESTSSAQVDTEGPHSIPASTYIAMPDEVGDWLIQDLWVDQALGFVAGIPKSMKSLLTLHIAYHVAHGEAFLTKKVLRSGPVLLVQEEDNDHIIRKRLRGLDHNADGLLHIWTPGITSTHIRLDLEAGVEALDREIARINPVLVILDPLANMHSLENENDAASMNRMLENLRHLRDYRKCSIMVVHHLRKEGMNDGPSWGQRMRGSSVLHAKSESALYLDRVGSSDLLKVRIETKLFPARTLEVRFREGHFNLDAEYGAGINVEDEEGGELK